MRKVLALWLLLNLALAGCIPLPLVGLLAGPSPMPTPQPTVTPRPTATSRPTPVASATSAEGPVRQAIIDAYTQQWRVPHRTISVTHYSDGETSGPRTIDIDVRQGRRHDFSEDFEMIWIESDGVTKIYTRSAGERWIQGPDYPGLAVSDGSALKAETEGIEIPVLVGRDEYEGDPVLVYYYEQQHISAPPSGEKTEYRFRIDFAVGEEDGLPRWKRVRAVVVSGEKRNYTNDVTYDYDVEIHIVAPQIYGPVLKPPVVKPPVIQVPHFEIPPPPHP